MSSHAGSQTYRLTGVTYGGVAMTQVMAYTGGTAAAVSMWYLLNPPLGPQTVVCSFNGDGYVMVRSLSGVASFGAGAGATAGGNPLTTTIASTVGRFVIDAATKQNAGTTHTMTPGAGQTVHYQDGGIATGPAVLGSIKAAAASTTLTWTDSPGGGLWGAQQLVEVIPLAGSALPPSMIVVSTTAADGSNHLAALSAIKPGDSLFVQSNVDATKAFRVDVTGAPVVTGGTVQIPVTPRSASWGAYPANGSATTMTVDYGSLSPVTTKGDLIQGSNANVEERLPIGSTGQVLTVSAGKAAWAAPSGIPATIVDAKGDLIVATAADTVGRRAVGTDGQVLTADSAQADGVKWATPAAAGIPATLVDAKGDLIVGTADNTVARRAVGADGTILTADSTQADGVKWAAPGGGMSNPMTTLGDVITGAASGVPARLGIGAAGNVLGVASGVPAWVGGPDSIPCVRNLAGSYVAAASTIALTADFAWLRDPTAKTTLLRPTLSATLNLTTSGPAVNGRDQAGNFGPNAWVYIYAIWNGTTLGVIASAAVPTTGPTLPSGYTHWAFLTALRVGGTANQWSLGGRVAGSYVFHEYAASVLSNGPASTETAVSLAAFVPPAAVAPRWNGAIGTEYTDTTANVTRYVSYRVISGGAAVFAAVMTTQVANIKTRVDTGSVFPNVAQNMYYLWDGATGTRAANLAVAAYVVVNGDA